MIVAWLGLAYSFGVEGTLGSIVPMFKNGGKRDTYILAGSVRATGGGFILALAFSMHQASNQSSTQFFSHHHHGVILAEPSI